MAPKNKALPQETKPVGSETESNLRVVVNFSSVANEQKVLVIAPLDLQQLCRTRQLRRQAFEGRQRARLRRRDVADGRRFDGGADFEAARRRPVDVDKAEAVGGHRVTLAAVAVAVAGCEDTEGLHRVLDRGE